MSADTSKHELPDIEQVKGLIKSFSATYPGSAALLLDLVSEMQVHHTAKIEEAEGAIAAVEQRWVDFQISNDLERAFHTAGGYPDEFSFLEPWATGRIKIDQSGKQKFFDKDGKPDQSVESIAQLIQKIIVERPGVGKHFGDPETIGATAGDGTKLTLSAWDAVEKTRAIDMQRQGQEQQRLGQERSEQASNPGMEGMSAWEQVELLRNPESLIDL
jgi:hypothetical protein